MKMNKLRLLAATGLIAFGTVTTADLVTAQTTVTATLATSSSITSALVADPDFGTWLIQLDATATTGDAVSGGGGNDGITLTMDNTGAVSAGSVDSASSQVVNTGGATTLGSLTVQTPAPAALTMTRTDGLATGGFGSGDMTLTTVTYETAINGANVIADAGTGTVTTQVAATDETISVYGVITVDETPTDGTHTQPFDFSFAY